MIRRAILFAAVLLLAVVAGAQTVNTWQPLTVMWGPIDGSGITIKASTILDANGNPFLTSSATASAVDSITITNAATATVPTVSIAPSGSDSNIALQLAPKGTGTVQAGGLWLESNNVAFLASDFPDLNSTTALQAITGLSFTLPANTALNVPFRCSLLYSQATAAVSDSFGVQDVTVAPTNIMAYGNVQTAATTLVWSNLPTLTTTTATAVVTFTPSAITTVWQADLKGFIQQPSNASSSVFQIMVSQATATDVITIKKGSYCVLGD